MILRIHVDEKKEKILAATSSGKLVEEQGMGVKKLAGTRAKE